MASSLDSLEAAGSPEKPGSSVIHLCMSVKRTVKGSVSGNLSVRPMAMSSRLSQPNVGGISTPEKDLTPRLQRPQRKDGGINPPLHRINDRAPWRNFCSSREFPR